MSELTRRKTLALGAAFSAWWLTGCKKKREPSPLVLAIAHAGERIPDDAAWLKGKPASVLATDLDRHLDDLYVPTARALGLDCVVAEYHRYAVDVNRAPESVDKSVVVGATAPPGSMPRGIHRVATTRGVPLLTEPISRPTHERLVKQAYEPHHQRINELSSAREGAAPGWSLLLDLHSFPSVALPWDLDPGKVRTMDIVVSDLDGKSARRDLVEMVRAAYADAGFRVTHNFPYLGSHTIRRHGRPEKRRHAIQVELNRAAYMNEKTFELAEPTWKDVRNKLATVLERLTKQGADATG